MVTYSSNLAQRRLMGYHPWGFKELDMTEHMQTHTHTHTHTHTTSARNDIPAPGTLNNPILTAVVTLSLEDHFFQATFFNKV